MYRYASRSSPSGTFYLALLAKQMQIKHNGNMHLSHALYRFSEVDPTDSVQVGKKGVLFGELVRAGFPVPNGFIIPSGVYFRFLKDNQLITKINHLLQTINYRDPHSLMQVSSHIRKLFTTGTLSEDLTKEIAKQYLFLGGELKDPTVVVRTAITSTVPSHLTGERESLVVVAGENALISMMLSHWAMLFDAKSLFHRHEKNVDAFSFGMAIIVQEFISADISGSVFSIDPLTQTKDSYRVEAIYGNREPQVTEIIPPDSYVVSKKSGEATELVIREQTMLRERVGHAFHTTRVPSDIQAKRKLKPGDLVALTELMRRLEQIHYFPFECQWAIRNGSLYVLGIKPLTLHPTETNSVSSSIDAPRIPHGVSHTQGIATGHVRILATPKDLEAIVSGEIVILPKLEEEHLKHLKRIYGIIIESPVTSQVLIQKLKELGRPTVSGIPDASKLYKNGSVITINANTGEVTTGGTLLTESHRHHSVSTPSQTSIATKLYLQHKATDNPETAAKLNVSGIGLLLGDSYIRALGHHPKKVIHEEKHEQYSAELAESLLGVVQSFYPRPVMYKLSDLPSSFYARLEGGKTYEPKEHNPHLGYRGAQRLIHDPDSASLELTALKTLREKHGMTNVQLILPTVRSVHELKQCNKLLKSKPFTKSPSFKIWLSVSTPENAVLIDSYIKEGIGGILIDVTALTTLFTGIDPENSEVAVHHSEENPAVLQAVQYILRRAQKHGLPVTVTGKSIANAYDLLELAVISGVSGIITPADSLENIRKTLYKYERKLIR